MTSWLVAGGWVTAILPPHGADGKMPSWWFLAGWGDGTLPSHRKSSHHLTTTFNAQNGTFFLSLFQGFWLLGQIKKPVTYTTTPAGRPMPRWCSFWFVYVTGFHCSNQFSLFSWSPIGRDYNITYRSDVRQWLLGIIMKNSIWDYLPFSVLADFFSFRISPKAI